MEHWLPVPDYEGVYSASDLGRVRIEVRRQNIRAGAILALSPSKDGYLQVALRRDEDKRPRHCAIARVVLSAFDRLPEPGEEANHKNGDIHDNRLENLEWLTQPKNIEHSIQVLGHTRAGAHNPAAKLTEAAVIELRKRAATGESYTSLGTSFGITNVMARNIAIGRHWPHVGGPLSGARPLGRPPKHP
jgi:hypothetical protein